MPVGSLAHESLSPAPAAEAEQDAVAEETTRSAETLATDTLIYREEAEEDQTLAYRPKAVGDGEGRQSAEENAEEDQTLAYRPKEVGDGDGRQSAEANSEEDNEMGLVEDII